MTELVRQSQDLAEVGRADPMQFILAAIDAIDILVAENADNTEGLAHAQELVTRMKDHISILDRSVNNALWKSMNGNEAFIEGVGYLRKDFATNWGKWQWKALIASILEKVPDHRVVDEETGEVESERAATARLLQECVGFSKGKPTGLKKLGINAEAYAEKSTGRQKVNITPDPTPGSKFLKQPQQLTKKEDPEQ